MTSTYEANARRLAQDNSPVGHLLRGLLAELDTARRTALFLAALVATQERRRTLGGIPAPFTSRWRNTALPAEIHPDYEGRL